jgi:hypothetical protein
MKVSNLLLTGLLISGLLLSPVQAKHLHKEADYQQAWCSHYNGQTEVELEDFTRADCVTRTHAIEFDFANKWAESVGQASWYGMNLHKRAGIVLIMENPEKDIYYLQRVIKLAKKYKIDVWTMKDLTDFESIAYKRRGLKLWKR